MVIQYCHNCGKKMSQASLKFCPYCGTNLNSLASQPPKDEPLVSPKQSNKMFKRPPIQATLDDDDDDHDPYENSDGIDINISELDVEITPINRGRETIGNLMAQGPNGEESRMQPNLGADEILENFRKEGSALRPRNKQRNNQLDDK